MVVEDRPSPSIDICFENAERKLICVFLNPPFYPQNSCVAGRGVQQLYAIAPMRERTPPDPLDLNNLVSQPQEKQSVLVLQWLADCESFLTGLTPEEVSQHQQTFQQAFLNLLSLPTPAIGHVLGNCLGRCFSDIFTRGDRRVLFDTVSTLLQKIGQLRLDKEAKQKQYYSM